MHPLLTTPRRLAIYLLAWLPFARFVHAILRGGGFPPEPLTIVFSLALAVLCAFLALSARYSNTMAPLHTSTGWRIVTVQGAAAGVSTILWLALGAGGLLIVERTALQPGLLEAYHAAVPLLFGLGMVGFVVSAALHYLGTAAERSREAERRALALQVVAREAELKTLRAQIDPHFLFNCLHSISALTTVDPPSARTMCVRLGDFLRTSLRIGNRPFITMGEELDLMRTYLGIEQVRLGSRLAVAEQIEPGTGAFRVPPLLLHPLVENAVTHGIGQLVEGGRVDLRVTRDDRHLRVLVANSCDPDRPPGSGAGVGLQNVRQRLSTVYGETASLSTRERPDWFEAELILPADPGVRTSGEPDEPDANRSR